jgi:hypothetical protein
MCAEWVRQFGSKLLSVQPDPHVSPVSAAGKTASSKNSRLVAFADRSSALAEGYADLR